MSSLQTGDPSLLGAAMQVDSQPITLHYYVPDVDSWYSFAERQLLSAIAQVAPRITVSVHPDRWDAQREAGLGIARTPAMALYGPQQQDTGIRYYGMPDGYEPATLAQTQQLVQPVHLEVLVSPT